MNPLKTSYITATAFAALVVPTISFADEEMATVELDPFETVAQRSFSTSNGEQLATSKDFDSVDLTEKSLQDLTQILNSNTSLSAYRRTSSKSAHPTTQGIRFRNIGINATSRTLVLLDGIPQNDPFGAWVFWNKFQIDSLAKVTTSKTSHNELWGNLGSGGLISLSSLPATRGRESLSLGYGTDDSYSVSFGKNEYITDSLSFDIDARTFDSGGFETIHPDDRGPIDGEAYSEADTARLRANWSTANGWEIQAVADYFSEERNNGTPKANNETEAWDYSISAQRVIDGNKQLNISAYHQTRDYSNQFAAVRDGTTTRSYDIPVLNQPDVPANSTGASVTYATHSKAGSEILFGIDARTIEGEVNEQSYFTGYTLEGDSYAGGGFVNGRKAGGQQDFVGFFYSTKIQVSPKTAATFSERIDRVVQSDGFLRQYKLATGLDTLNETYASTREWLPSFNFKLEHEIDEKRLISANIFQGFRAPTLNELYRPFRVGNDTTTANAELKNETHRGIEFAYLCNYSEKLNYSVKAFHYLLEDMVANVLLSSTPTSSLSQRRNIDRSEVTGLEFEVNAQITDNLSTTLNYTYAPTEIKSSSAVVGQPSLEGDSFPQAPESKAFAQIQWTPIASTNLWASLTYWDEQFEDLAGTRRIDSATIVDLGASFKIDEDLSLQLRIENLADSEVESGVSSSGVVSISAPRTAWISFSYKN